ALGAVYLYLLSVTAKGDDLEEDKADDAVVMPKTWETFRAGMHYFLPIVVLVWCLMVEMLSPGLAAFWSIMCTITIVLTQRPIKAYFRKQKTVKAEWHKGVSDFVD